MVLILIYKNVFSLERLACSKLWLEQINTKILAQILVWNFFPTKFVLEKN